MLFIICIATLLGFNQVLAGDLDANKKGKNLVIFDAINVIATETRKLDEVLQGWDGSVGGAMPINSQTTVILSSIKQGMKDTEESRGLGIGGALKVKRATLGLIKDTTNVTMDLIYMKDRFRAITLGGLVKGNLKMIQEASNEFNQVVVKKLPGIGRPIGRRLGRKVNKIFTKVIEEYESNEPAPIQPPPKELKTSEAEHPTTTTPTPRYRRKQLFD